MAFDTGRSLGSLLCTVVLAASCSSSTTESAGSVSAADLASDIEAQADEVEQDRLEQEEAEATELAEQRPGLPDANDIEALDRLAKAVTLDLALADASFDSPAGYYRESGVCPIMTLDALSAQVAGTAAESTVSSLDETAVGMDARYGWEDLYVGCSFGGLLIWIETEVPGVIDSYGSVIAANLSDGATLTFDETEQGHKVGYITNSDAAVDSAWWSSNDTAVGVQYRKGFESTEVARLVLEAVIHAVLSDQPDRTDFPGSEPIPIDASELRVALLEWASIYLTTEPEGLGDIRHRFVGECPFMDQQAAEQLVHSVDPSATVVDVDGELTGRGSPDFFFDVSAWCEFSTDREANLSIEVRNVPYDTLAEWVQASEVFDEKFDDELVVDSSLVVSGLPDDATYSAVDTRAGTDRARHWAGVLSHELDIQFTLTQRDDEGYVEISDDIADRMAGAYANIVNNLLTATS